MLNEKVKILTTHKLRFHSKKCLEIIGLQFSSIFLTKYNLYFRMLNEKVKTLTTHKLSFHSRKCLQIIGLQFSISIKRIKKKTPSGSQKCRAEVTILETKGPNPSILQQSINPSRLPRVWWHI